MQGFLFSRPVAANVFAGMLVTGALAAH